MSRGPKFTYHEKVVLRAPKTFYLFSQARGRLKHELPKGTIVEVERPEALHNDHGRFDRYWYHLRYKKSGWQWWTAIGEEDAIGSPDVLEQLADI